MYKKDMEYRGRQGQHAEPAAGYDPVAEALGLKPDGNKAIDFDDSTQVG